jgi:glutathione S-transferase
MFIHEKGLDIPVVEVDLRHRKQFDAEFVRKNPRCTVPVLELDGGEFITDTLAICSYLEDCFPDPPLMGVGAEQRSQVLAWYMHILEDGFMAVSESFRNFARGFRENALTGSAGHAQIPELVERGRRRADRFFSDMNEHLAGREYVVGEAFSLADIAALATVDFAGWIKMEISDEQVDLRRWHASVSARPSAKL